MPSSASPQFPAVYKIFVQLEEGLRVLTQKEPRKFPSSVQGATYILASLHLISEFPLETSTKRSPLRYHFFKFQIYIIKLHHRPTLHQFGCLEKRYQPSYTAIMRKTSNGTLQNPISSSDSHPINPVDRPSINY